jgi:hypothetical protein
VNNNSGQIRIVGQRTTCSNNETLVTWSSGPGGGLLAGADFQCVGGLITPGGLFSFQLSSSGVNFGSAISTTGTQFSSFVLQPGIYQIHLSGAQFEVPIQFRGSESIAAQLSSGNSPTAWLYTPAPVQSGAEVTTKLTIVGGDRLISVGQLNTTLQFVNDLSIVISAGTCELVITKLQ